MILMLVLFPLLSLLLAAWMTIFGFYLRLEEKAWERWQVIAWGQFDVWQGSQEREEGKVGADLDF